MTTNGNKKKLRIAIVGGGLVGSLEALFLAKRGHDVHLFEFREDIRKTPHVKGKSINLAMSMRARLALKEVGLEEQMIEGHGIPMRARMIHSLEGNIKEIPYDPNNNQATYSVARRYLNELLLTESEKYPNVTRHFNHKLIEANFRKKSLAFLQTANQSKLDFSADLVIGADGAFSAVRKAMMKEPLFDFNQTYIEHGYIELCIPPTHNNEFAMPPNYLHIWPRGSFMMIALPNQDKSWTVTLFMPFKNFKDINSEESLIDFFKCYFPDSIPLLGKKRLIKDFFSGTPCPLVAIKCRPYHVEDKALIIGDAAHAMVPFYGQGMNTGFEDCYILDKLMTKHGADNIGRVLEEFSETRWKDAHAICDLAAYNYVEMRDLVNRRSYLLRKKMDDFLFWAAPNYWVPLYNSVTFTSMSYTDCISNREWQNQIINRIIFFMTFCGMLIIAFIVQSYKTLQSK